MYYAKLFTEAEILSRSEVLSSPCPVPDIYGVYGWFFQTIPGQLSTDECIEQDRKTLLYIGISPDKSNKPKSRQNLRNRIRYHYNGNAYGSTLRLSLGVLLSRESGFPLRRVGSSGTRMTFTQPGEAWLNEWLNDNAFVCWLIDSDSNFMSAVHHRAQKNVSPGQG